MSQYREQFRYKGRDTFAPQQAANFSRAGQISGQDVAGSQLKALGSAIGQVGQTVTNIHYDREKAEVNNAINAYQDEYIAWQTSQKQKQGEHALKTQEEYEAFRIEKLAKSTENFSDFQKRKFEESTRNIIATQKAWASDYEYGEEQKFLDASDVSSINNAGNQIAANPDSYGAEIQRVIDISYEQAQRKGLDEEATELFIRENITKVHVNVLDTRIYENNLGAAESTLKSAKGAMDEKTYAYYENLIKERRMQNVATNKENIEKKQKQAQDQFVTNELNRLVNTYANYPTIEERRSHAKDDVYLKYPEDKDREKRNALLNAVDKEYDYMKDAEKQHAQKELFQAQHAMKNMSPAQRQEYYSNIDRDKTSTEGMKLITDYYMGKNEEETPENQAITQDLMLAVDKLYDENGRLYSDDELIKMFATYNITTKQKAQITEYARNAGVEGMLKQSNFNDAMKFVYGIETKKKPDDDFINFIKKQLPHGRVAEQGEINKIAARYVMDGTNKSIESSFWSSNNLTYKQAYEQGKLDVWLPDVEENEVSYIDEQLKQAGHRINDYNRSLYKKQEILDMEDDGLFEVQTNKK